MLELATMYQTTVQSQKNAKKLQTSNPPTTHGNVQQILNSCKCCEIKCLTGAASKGTLVRGENPGYSSYHFHFRSDGKVLVGLTRQAR